MLKIVALKHLSSLGHSTGSMITCAYHQFHGDVGFFNISTIQLNNTATLFKFQFQQNGCYKFDSEPAKCRVRLFLN